MSYKKTKKCAHAVERLPNNSMKPDGIYEDGIVEIKFPTSAKTYRIILRVANYWKV